MHELSITRNIVAIVQDRAAGRSIRSVRLQIGRLSGIEIQAVRFCFDICTAGTALEGAVLEIDEVAGRGTCEECGEGVELERFVLRCPCERRAPVKIVEGEELLIKSMEVQ